MIDAPGLPAPLRGVALARLWAALPEARVVGGAVRDVLAGRLVADVDLATPRLPEESTRALEAAGLRVIPTGLGHGTVTALVDGIPFEVTTLRRDVATDGRHATVAFTEDWQADAARRDFTINAMSMDRGGVLFDYFAGRADLAGGVVRFVGDADARIAEDYLRVLRFFRFHGRYGRQQPDPALTGALTRGIPGLAHLSAERIWSEVSRILATPDPVEVCRLMQALGVLTAVLPGKLDVDRLAALVEAGAPPLPLLQLAALTDADALTLAERFRLSVAERDQLVGLRSGPAANAADDAAELRRKLADTSVEDLTLRAWLDGEPPALATRLAETEKPVFPVLGRDLLALGVPAGPEMGRTLQTLRRRWLAGGCVADKASLLAVLE